MNDIKDYLSIIGWNQNTLAKRIEVNPRTVSRWITGETRTPFVVIEYLRLMSERQ